MVGQHIIFGSIDKFLYLLCNKTLSCNALWKYGILSIVLTDDAWVSGPDLAPQKFFLSQKFRNLMRCKKYLEKIQLFVYIFGWNSKWPPEVRKGSPGQIERGNFEIIEKQCQLFVYKKCPRNKNFLFLIRFWRNFVRL